MPKVSVIMPFYNQERFVARSINSILAQTEKDFELIVVDDFSSDNTVEEIKKFSDERIKLILHPYNRGPNAGVNSAFENSSGEYIVFMAGDDMLYPDHLEKSVGYLEKNPETDIYYCLLTAIDENDREINTPSLENWIPASGDRAQSLHDLFLTGNVFLSPGMVVRKNLLEKICPLPVSQCVTQDYQEHILFLLNNANYFQSDERLVYYRRVNNNKNLSSGNETAVWRVSCETEVLMDTFFKMSVEQIKTCFAKELADLKLEVLPETKEFVLGRLALTAVMKERRIWGYHVLMRFLRDKKNFDLVHDLYGFDFKQLLALTRVDSVPVVQNERPFVAPKGIEKFFYKLFRHFQKRRLKKDNRQ